MNPSVLDILLYLFENFLLDEGDEPTDQDSLRSALLDAGFPLPTIQRAFAWLAELSGERSEAETARGASRALRMFTPAEIDKLEPEARGFIWHLESIGAIDADRRELILDQVMALDEPTVDLEDLKWVILMVMSQLPGQEAALAWMEQLVFEDAELRPN